MINSYFFWLVFQSLRWCIWTSVIHLSWLLLAACLLAHKTLRCFSQTTCACSLCYPLFKLSAAFLNSCKSEHIAGITLWRKTVQPQSAQLFWAISIMDANAGLVLGLSKNREISIFMASPEPAVSLLPALVVTFRGWWIWRVVQGVM